MKKLIILLTWALLLAVVSHGYALEVPPLKGYVNDYAGMLSSAEAAQISTDLDSYEKTTSTQIFVLTIPSLEGEVLEGFSIKVAESWKAGQKLEDNGIIILLVKNDRKVRIEVGQGLEGSVTDLTSGRIIREDMIPYLKEGQTALALQAAIDKIKLAVNDEFKGEAGSRRSGAATGSTSGNSDATRLGMAFIIFLVIAGIASAINYLLGGVVGAVLAPLLGLFMFHAAFSTLLFLIVIGFGLGMVASQLGMLALMIGFGGRGGGGGGGFGGGGGGGFGGGGASGDW